MLVVWRWWMQDSSGCVLELEQLPVDLGEVLTDLGLLFDKRVDLVGGLEDVGEGGERCSVSWGEAVGE